MTCCFESSMNLPGTWRACAVAHPFSLPRRLSISLILVTPPSPSVPKHFPQSTRSSSALSNAPCRSPAPQTLDVHTPKKLRGIARSLSHGVSHGVQRGISRACPSVLERPSLEKRADERSHSNGLRATSTSSNSGSSKLSSKSNGTCGTSTPPRAADALPSASPRANPCAGFFSSHPIHLCSDQTSPGHGSTPVAAGNSLSSSKFFAAALSPVSLLSPQPWLPRSRAPRRSLSRQSHAATLADVSEESTTALESRACKRASQGRGDRGTGSDDAGDGGGGGGGAGDGVGVGAGCAGDGAGTCARNGGSDGDDEGAGGGRSGNGRGDDSRDRGNAGSLETNAVAAPAEHASATRDDGRSSEQQRVKGTRESAGHVAVASAAGA
mmetsp:Transcript_40110/g.88067  ORF Transcript_40110/g.88067 Transcript_40110/m.88067 type:complete len:382 (-) Transcript_40110:525-1670(-)